MLLQSFFRSLRGEDRALLRSGSILRKSLKWLPFLDIVKFSFLSVSAEDRYRITKPNFVSQSAYDPGLGPKDIAYVKNQINEIYQEE